MSDYAPPTEGVTTPPNPLAVRRMLWTLAREYSETVRLHTDDPTMLSFGPRLRALADELLPEPHGDWVKAYADSVQVPGCKCPSGECCAYVHGGGRR